MGSETIVYGHLHGNSYQSAEEVNPDILNPDGTYTYYPNGMVVRSWPDLGHVAIGVQRYDEFGNPIGGTEFNEMIGSLWADLDRAGCNRLIAGLRKHRDRAFGRDE